MKVQILKRLHFTRIPPIQTKTFYRVNEKRNMSSTKYLTEILKTNLNFFFGTLLYSDQDLQVYVLMHFSKK